MKKRVFVILFACLLLLTACGAPAEETAPVEAPETVETPAEPEEPVAEEIPEEPVVEEVPEAPVEPEVPEDPAGPTVEDALAFVDQPLSDLIAAIGEPIGSYYEYSCSGPGDDGLLTYDGFFVFTYREPDGSAETVIDAEVQ